MKNNFLFIVSAISNSGGMKSMVMPMGGGFNGKTSTACHQWTR